MNAEGVEYITFGALALAAHGLPRTTTDADFFIKPDVGNIERLKKALRSVWSDPEIENITASDLLGDYPAVTYGPPDEEFSIDFLTRLGDAYRYDDLPLETIEFEGVPIRLVPPRTLYEMKRDTVRAKDKADAAALREKFKLDQP